MRQLTEARFEEIMNEDSDLLNVEGDSTTNGIKILLKYMPNGPIIEASEHDIIYAVGIEDILDAGITEEDALELRRNNWMISEYSLAKYC